MSRAFRLFALLFALCTLISCTEGDSDLDATDVVYTVVFDTNGGSNISSIKVEKGSTATAPNPPSKEGYDFDGWYINNKYTAKWSFESVVTSDMTLYAKWSLVVEEEEEDDDVVDQNIVVTLLETTSISDLGLYFDGVQGVNYQFGKQITPHGDCVDVLNGYIFYAWYRGGMEDRHLMLSRKPVEGGEWKTIEFPEQHVGYNFDPTIGDSHNIAAVAVCPIDNTVHIIFDIHSYSKSAPDGRFFNYIVSKKNVAFVEDDEWTIDNFESNRNYLNSESWDETTYPDILRTEDGELVCILRYGGSGSGNHFYTRYDGSSWLSQRVYYSTGIRSSNDDKNSIYGTFQYLHGKLYELYSIRYSVRREYSNNNGLFYSVIDEPFAASPVMKDLWGNTHELPIEEVEKLQFAEPGDLGYGTSITSGPVWTVTSAGDIHAIITVSGTNLHYWCKAGSTEFSYAEVENTGTMYAVGNKVLLVGIDSRPFISVCEGGTNSWVTAYKGTSSTYRLMKSAIDGDKLVLCLMRVGSGDAQPLESMTFDIY